MNAQKMLEIMLELNEIAREHSAKTDAGATHRGIFEACLYCDFGDFDAEYRKKGDDGGVFWVAFWRCLENNGVLAESIKEQIRTRRQGESGRCNPYEIADMLGSIARELDKGAGS